ncbi:hypothetical protein GCM10025760_24270 [Microbacterium yannicii]|uniref:LPXTG cell wall anchor domain-containing protein n=1 Tax=Microbacterium yannicii TaxID=671622 RepID=A0ABP9MDK9_9MICO|nr:hypothetical protein [Microbacterium yannicii]MCO5952808.1 hypothetical protein [Microbacterium yannicii]
MLKKTLAAAGIAGALILGSSAAAFADYPATAPVTAGDTTLTVGQSTTITANDLGDYTSVDFSVNPTSGSTLSSIVVAAAAGGVTKPVANGTASATFTANAAGTYTVTVAATDGALGSVTISVAAAGSTPAPGALPATGGTIPAAAIWVGVGAVGLGGIAVAAVAARRRTQKN